MKMPFSCVRCGLCCRSLKGVGQLRDFDNGNGVCVNIRQDNTCRIYAARPLWCNVADAYDKIFSGSMSEEEFIAANLKACIELCKRAGDYKNHAKLKKMLDDAGAESVSQS